MMNDKVNRRRCILRNHRPFSFVDLNLQIAKGAGGRFGKCVICMGSRISAGLCQMRLVFCKGVEQLFRIKQAGEERHIGYCANSAKSGRENSSSTGLVLKFPPVSGAGRRHRIKWCAGQKTEYRGRKETFLKKQRPSYRGECGQNISAVSVLVGICYEKSLQSTRLIRKVNIHQRTGIL